VPVVVANGIAGLAKLFITAAASLFSTIIAAPLGLVVAPSIGSTVAPVPLVSTQTCFSSEAVIGIPVITASLVAAASVSVIVTDSRPLPKFDITTVELYAI
tara:strand:+ start:12813 stop:13115 length:303 start_codon:yes stop_codon:yes gene_type:complete